MGKLDIFSGKRILKKEQSEINGELSVEYELGWGTFIRGGGLPQSGGLARTIWEKSLNEIHRSGFEPKTLLVLGFGGGGIAHISKKLWEDCEIYGVDIDPVMVELGKKYLKWEQTGAHVVIEDANKFIAKLLTAKSNSKSLLPTTYDLICVDMYVQDAVPEQFNSLKFIQQVKKLLTPHGLAVFNRLYGARDRKIAIDFAKKLDKVFSEIHPIFPDANVMYVCANDEYTKV